MVRSLHKLDASNDPQKSSDEYCDIEVKLSGAAGSVTEKETHLRSCGNIKMVRSSRVSPIHTHDGSRGSLAYLRKKSCKTFASVDEGGTTERERCARDSRCLR